MSYLSWLPIFSPSRSKTVSPDDESTKSTVEWQVNGHCNYDCPYCIQSRQFRRGTPDSSTIEAIVIGFSKLPGEWEIKMTGGEPFAFKGFIEEVIPSLMAETPHVVSVLTNFSAPRNTLRRFCELTGERLRITSASLHPDTADVEEFIAKAVEYREMRKALNPNSSFVVNVVMVPGKVKNHFRYRDAMAMHELRYFPQLMKTKGGVFPYSDDERAMIEELTGGSHDPTIVNRAPSYRGLHCDAGVRYFVVDQKGEAYTCRTGKRFSRHSNRSQGTNSPLSVIEAFDDEADDNNDGYLGSFVRGDFRLRRLGGLCPYPICPCTVPANRGIVQIPKRMKNVEADDGDR